ncbi:MAG: hypothetical protein A3C27_00225 [Candidatus Levybacteria bacterium RIFCSPHIGHO2_02_FULL_39_36]|nr:MAG: hypothetical protein UT20_C0035G0011 [Candidatus Levybacteria bacterium GW2011_GWA1_39_11]KKR48807.1 MAG: hypothetical protein UT85_C0027G0011 [Candidatus Levybacteria bacterium GW2011_GWA2_40_16]OGH15024.1 MAG: hypothetical protein A2689_02110 [Candidatus Levybacteria bacterium RIFCSPHIGHO2_01_FULL_38_96]OGH25715.1 MAG: hypothetical protein A3E68_00810 [Candidatus Levybacteria bacterium RIFCSPHIGHO2_12_FULL_39_39]OGH28650.1 MAG: hypothetical protein A3C27_00225 [Candidatus Levybacteria
MIDTQRFFTILIEGISFVAAFAAVAAAFIMYEVTKKFGSGILASGFKSISAGVLFLALGIIIDALNSYFLLSYNNIYSVLVFLIKGICFVVGTYIIVIGSKRTADKLESLTK